MEKIYKQIEGELSTALPGGPASPARPKYGILSFFNDKLMSHGLNTHHVHTIDLILRFLSSTVKIECPHMLRSDCRELR